MWDSLQKKFHSSLVGAKPGLLQFECLLYLHNSKETLTKMYHGDIISLDLPPYRLLLQPIRGIGLINKSSKIYVKRNCLFCHDHQTVFYLLFCHTCIILRSCLRMRRRNVMGGQLLYCMFITELFICTGPLNDILCV